MRSLITLTVALTLLIPGALATEASGILVAASAQFPPRATIDGNALALMLNTSDPHALVTFHAARLHLVAFAKDYVGVDALQVQPPGARRTEHDFTNATVSLVVRANTIVGGTPGPTAHLSFLSPDPVEVEAHREYVVSDVTFTQAATADLPWYRVDVKEPSVAFRTVGTMSIAGEWNIKLRNTVARVSANEGNFEFEATEREESPVQLVRRWVVLDSPDIEGRLASTTSAIVAVLASGSTQWKGLALVTGASGEIHQGTAAYHAQREQVVTLDGDLSTTFASRFLEGEAVASFSISGDLQSTSLIPASSTVAPAPIVPVWIIGALALGLAASGSGVLLLVRRPKHAAEPLPVAEPEPIPPTILVPPDAEIRRLIETDGIEAVTDLMEEVGGNEQWHDALRVARIVQEVAPTSLRLALNIAIFLEFTGDVEGALRAYEHASSLSPDDGHIEYDASVTARSNGLPPEVTEGWILRALQKTPELWPEVRALPPALSHRPAIRRAIRAARERLDDDF